jgi:hypothetical protein
VHRALSQLEIYGYQLHNLLTLDRGLDLTLLPSFLAVYPIAAATSAWRVYIIHESARRTLLLIFFMMSLCHALRGEMRYCRAQGSLSSYLLGSSHLWNASSSFDFAKAWNEKERLLVDNMDFDQLLSVAQPEDVDLFGRMLLVAKLGIDEVRGGSMSKEDVFEIENSLYDSSFRLLYRCAVLKLLSYYHMISSSASVDMRAF